MSLLNGYIFVSPFFLASSIGGSFVELEVPILGSVEGERECGGMSCLRGGGVGEGGGEVI